MDNPKEESNITSDEVISFRRESVALSLTLIVSRLYPVINQIGASQISEKYLFAMAFLGLLPLGYSIISQALGLPLLVLAAKGTGPQTTNYSIGNILILNFFFCGLISLLLIGLHQNILSYFHVDQIPNIFIPFVLTVLAGFIYSFSGVLFFPLSVHKKSKVLIISAVISLLISFVGNVASTSSIFTTEARFLVLIWTGLLSQLFFAVTYFYFTRRFIFFNLQSANEYLISSYALIGGELFNSILNLEPLIFSFIFVKYFTVEAAGTYTVVFTWVEVLYVPLTAILLIGTPWLAKSYSEKHSAKWHMIRSVIHRDSVLTYGIGALLLGLSHSLILDKIYGIQSSLSSAIALISILGVLPASMFNSKLCQIRAFEKQDLAARASFIAYAVVSIPLTWVFASQKWVILAITSCSVLPATLLLLWFKFREDDFEQLRRNVARTVIPNGIEINVFVERQQFRILDISQSGFSFEVKEGQGSHQRGDLITGVIALPNSSILNFTGEIRSSNPIRRKFQIQSKSLAVGVQFTNIPQDTLTEIELLVKNLGLIRQGNF